MRNVFVLPLVIILQAALFSQTRQGAAPQTIAFTRVTVIDPASAAVRRDLTVVITGNRISALGKTGEVAMPKGAQVVDATGKFMIPGLWDMHAHFAYEAGDVEKIYFPLQVINGVTGVRDMGSVGHPIERIKDWRARIAEGKLIGPRIGQTGMYLEHLEDDESVTRASVRRIKRSGYDFVKVYSFISRVSFFAAVDEMKRQGISFAGHVPAALNVGEASDAGQRSIEHLQEMLASSSTKEAELRKEAADWSKRIAELKGKPLTPALIEEGWRLLDKNIETYSEEKAAALAARFVKNNTWHCPTLVVNRQYALREKPEIILGDPRASYIPLSHRHIWWLFAEAERAYPADWFAAERRRDELHLRMVKLLHRAGVGILAGADATGYPFPGFSLHDELALFVQAGLTPLEALRTATFNPAKYLGLLDSLGAIEPGKIADLALLDADPLEEISNTKRIHAVVVNGRYLPKERLQKMLSEIEAEAEER
jgi:imidazolonepropionase-like amidohydrolase